MSTGAAHPDPFVTDKTPPPPPIAPRGGADAELDALLEEIPTWPDDMLVHMYQRFGASRLFRVHHQADGPLTGSTMRLRARAAAEMEKRGLPVPSDEN